MAKLTPEMMDSLPEWDCGTYQTGSTTPPKRTSGMLTLLMLLVVFLGGLVSVLGLVNIRLIKQLATTPEVTIPASQGDPFFSVSDDSIFNTNLPTPSMPEDRDVQLHLEESPYYSNNSSQQALPDMQAVYEHNRHALVEIHALTYSHSTQSGVGVVLSKDGYILTNAHLVEASKRVLVYLSDGRLLPALVVGSDNLTDMAVLYVDAQDLTPAVFGTSKTLQVADPIYTVSLQNTARSTSMQMFAGSMFYVSRKFSTDHYSLNLLQTCHHSESGPLFNSFGQIVGLCVSHTAQYFHASDNLGVVVGSNSMQTIIDQLVQQGYVSGRPELGFSVEVVSKLFQHYWNLPGGLLVSQVREDSNAALQGLKNGDILLALDGEPLNTRTDLYTVLYSCYIGQEIIAVVFRDGVMVPVTLTVEEFCG